jgi:hypothetical protein
MVSQSSTCLAFKPVIAQRGLSLKRRPLTLVLRSKVEANAFPRGAAVLAMRARSSPSKRSLRAPEAHAWGMTQAKPNQRRAEPIPSSLPPDELDRRRPKGLMSLPSQSPRRLPRARPVVLRSRTVQLPNSIWGEMDKFNSVLLYTKLVRIRESYLHLLAESIT